MDKEMQQAADAWDYEKIEQIAMKNWNLMHQKIITFNENMDASHDQEIKAYIDKAVADIARKCGVDQSEVWAEMNYWARDKG